MENLIIVSISFIAPFVAWLMMEIIEYIKVNEKESFTNVYNRQQYQIAIKKAHKAGLQAGEYGSEEYNQAYDNVLDSIAIEWQDTSNTTLEHRL